MRRALYLNHPYHRPIIGWRHEMETLDREDALAFYQRFYAPEQRRSWWSPATSTADEVKALAEKTYGKIAAREPRRRRACARRSRRRSPSGA